MGAGILPATMRNGKLWFLFGKENKFESSAPGFSDFGGGSDDAETPLQTAIREGGEELTGFLGTDDELRKMLAKHGTYDVDFVAGKYKTHIFPMAYDPYLEKYYNNNQKFIQRRLDPAVIKSSKIFEKAEIRWVCIDDFSRMRSKFRPFYLNVIDTILREQVEIRKFLVKSRVGTRKNRHRE